MKDVVKMDKLNAKILNKSIILYLLYSAFLLIFNLLYSQTHYCTSSYINYTFLIPFILGFGTLSIIKRKKIKLAKLNFLFYNLATISLSIYFICKGITEYINYSTYINILLYLTVILFIISFLLLLPTIFLHFFPIVITNSSK